MKPAGADAGERGCFVGYNVDVAMVSRTLEALLDRRDRVVAMNDPAAGQARVIDAALAAAPDGLLPVFLVAADTVWRDATQRSFGIALSRDPGTLLGYRAERVSGGPFSSVMLAMMEAIDQVARPTVILVNDFNQLWRDFGRDLDLASEPRRAAGPAPVGS